MHIEEPKLGRAAVRSQFDWPEDAIVCLHAGNMGSKQGLSNIIECARLTVQDDPRYLFVLMGDGNQRPLLIDLAERYRLPNVRFLPIQPAERFSCVLAAADLLLVNQRASVINMSLPSRLTSYFSSGRPVVAAVASESETASEIRSNDTGVLVPPDRPELLLQALRDLVADPIRQERLGAAGTALCPYHPQRGSGPVWPRDPGRKGRRDPGRPQAGVGMTTQPPRRAAKEWP